MNEDQIRQIVRDEMQKNYQSGSPDVPPHTHNGTDGLNINPNDLTGFTIIPTTNVLYKNPLGEGFVRSISVKTAGTGYTVGDVITIIGSINNATAVITSVGGGGAVTGISIQRGGTGYSTSGVGGTSTSGGTGTGLVLNITTGGYEYGFGSPVTLYPQDSNGGTQFVLNTTTSQYPIPVVVGNGRNGGFPQGEFMGGYSPDGTLIAFMNGSTADLYIRYDGHWYGVNMPILI